MTYSDEFKVCWFTPMRTATRSTHTLLKALGFHSLGTHSFSYPSERFGYRLISNIRNPYSRMVSLFSLYSIHKNNFTFDFKNWADYALNDDEFEVGYQLRYDKKILSLNEKFFKFVKVENYVEDLSGLDFINLRKREIENIWNNTILRNSYEYEFKKISSDDKKTWMDFYDDEIASLVYSKLKYQFELFDYDKNSWKNGTP